MSIRIFTNNISNVRKGNTQVTRVYLGGSLVWTSFVPTLQTITATGSYTVTPPAGAMYVDRIVIGAGGGGSGAGIGNSAGGNGGNTTCTYGGSTITGSGGTGGPRSGSSPNGKSPGDHTWNGQTYIGGAVQVSVGGAGNAPGGGGNRANAIAVSGGEAGLWASSTLTLTNGNITGTVGSGGSGGGGFGGSGGAGAAGRVFLYFY